MLLLAGLGWAALWYLTPGLHGRGLGSHLGDEVQAVLLETAAAAGLLVVIVLLHRRETRRLFARSRWAALYVVPLVLAVALPWHYTMPLPVGVYLLWMTVSVLWQDYLTFGLLQSYARDRLPPWATVASVAVVFYLGHAVLLPSSFAPPNVLPALGILALGLLFAAVRERLGTLHLLLTLHLSFYFVFA